MYFSIMASAGGHGKVWSQWCAQIFCGILGIREVFMQEMPAHRGIDKAAQQGGVVCMIAGRD
jgi:hypothetical protein